jgi:acyl-CoA hydrolase
VTVKASVNDVGTTSLEIGVRVESEELETGTRTHTSSAYLVFVALDDEGKPRPVPPLDRRDRGGAAPPALRRRSGARRGSRTARRSPSSDAVSESMEP